MNRQPRVFMMDLWATVPYYTAYLSKALLHEPLHLTVGSISYYLDPICFSSRGIKVHPGLLNIVGRFRLPRTPRRILKLLESLLNLSALTVRFLISPPDIIHVQYLPMLQWPLPLDLWFIKLFHRRRAKIVLTVHDILPHDTGERHHKTFHKLYQWVDRLICHSDNIRTRLHTEFSVPLSRIDVIPHGPFFYDLPASSNESTMALETGTPLVLWQGIIFPYKGVDLLLNAWQQVEASGVPAHLVIAGPGSPELLQQIRDLITHLHLQHVELRPIFISPEELIALYRLADIVVYPYRAITTSGALATGLALGKTIVASDLPVFRELLTNRHNALLIDPEDAAQLAVALIELLRDPKLRLQLASNVETMHFGDQSWLSIARQTMKSYVDALQ
jgi:glycosyltransferase involved in cell wall biosynthesis